MACYCLFIEDAAHIPEPEFIVCLYSLLFSKHILPFQDANFRHLPKYYRFNLTLYDVLNRYFLSDTYEGPLHLADYQDINIIDIPADDLHFFITDGETTVAIILEVECLILDPINRIHSQFSSCWTIIKLDSSSLSSDISDRNKRGFNIAKQTVQVWTSCNMYYIQLISLVFIFCPQLLSGNPRILTTLLDIDSICLSVHLFDYILRLPLLRLDTLSGRHILGLCHFTSPCPSSSRSISPSFYNS